MAAPSENGWVVSRTGQLPSDYGEHWSPPTVWSLFGPCGCGAEKSRPCLDRRVRHLPARELWEPHAGRQCFLVPLPEGAEEFQLGAMEGDGFGG